MSKLNDLKDLNKKLEGLTEEYLKAVKIEAGILTYELKHEGFGYYHLIKLSSGEIIVSGEKERLRSYIRIRNINPATIINETRLPLGQLIN